MSKFKYNQISLTGSAFRVLRLLKGNGDPIQCEVFETKLPPLQDVGGYTALSYTWGSKARPCEIIINGSRMEITKNAYLALRDLRYQEEDRNLWIDALCIDQNNMDERSQQVKQMGNIYGKADRVIIWLGEATYDTDYVMHYMNHLEKKLEQDDISFTSNDVGVPDKQLERIWLETIQGLNGAQKGLLVEGFQLLLHRNWFKRVWIIQEAANAQVAEITCGSRSVSTSIFTRMAFLLGVTMEPHCESILNIMPGPLRDHSWWSEKPDLYTMLDKFRHSEATDPRDRIYALLGISSDTSNTDLLKVDYNQELQDVIFNTVSFLLNFNKLEFPPPRFFDWGFSEFLKNLGSLVDAVLKCAMNTEIEDWNEAVVQLLIEQGADINVKDNEGRILLSWAAANRYEAVVKLLLAKDQVHINSQDSGRTPLSWAVVSGHEAIARLLVDKGADINAQDYDGQTALFWAVVSGHEAVVRLLVDKGADVTAKSDSGWTALYWAAEKGHEAAVRLLVDYGANVNTKNYHGQTALYGAAANGHMAVVRLLVESGADVNAQDDDGQTALFWAASAGHEAVVRLLVDSGADFNARSNGGSTTLYRPTGKGIKISRSLMGRNTALYIAAEEGHEAVVRLLVDSGADFNNRANIVDVSALLSTPFNHQTNSDTGGGQRWGTRR